MRLGLSCHELIVDPHAIDFRAGGGNRGHGDDVHRNTRGGYIADGVRYWKPNLIADEFTDRGGVTVVPLCCQR